MPQKTRHSGAVGFWDNAPLTVAPQSQGGRKRPGRSRSIVPRENFGRNAEGHSAFQPLDRTERGSRSDSRGEMGRIPENFGHLSQRM